MFSMTTLMDLDAQDYSKKPIPLAAYSELMAIYALSFTALYHLATRDGKELRRPRGLDLALLSLASYKFARVITMSFIASPLRAPFTHRGPGLKGGEVQDEPRGEGLQRAIGSLLTCPFCFSVWSSTAFTFGYTFSPQATRQVAYILSLAAVGDILHLGFRNARELSE
ncbi:MAG: DUF1360 domain-containing protein [Proteobacteria bacterium]|nr:MAG: DUF1360 domain-containing protein [Pseudomonadota bacterium]